MYIWKFSRRLKLLFDFISVIPFGSVISRKFNKACYRHENANEVVNLILPSPPPSRDNTGNCRD